jgi:hypothetical protein
MQAHISIIKERLFLSNVSEESSENSELLKFSALIEAHLYRPMIVHTSSQNSNFSIFQFLLFHTWFQNHWAHVKVNHSLFLAVERCARFLPEYFSSPFISLFISSSCLVLVKFGSAVYLASKGLLFWVHQTDSEYTQQGSSSWKHNNLRNKSMKLLSLVLVLSGCLQSFVAADFQGKTFTAKLQIKYLPWITLGMQLAYSNWEIGSKATSATRDGNNCAVD